MFSCKSDYVKTCVWGVYEVIRDFFRYFPEKSLDDNGAWKDLKTIYDLFPDLESILPTAARRGSARQRNTQKSDIYALPTEQTPCPGYRLPISLISIDLYDKHMFFK